MDAPINPQFENAALAALTEHFLHMPPVAALQPRIVAHGDGVLRLAAPLAVNVNDKGCAFGGSLVSMMTIAAWGLVTLEVGTAGIAADVYVADSRVRYLKPVFEELLVEARFDETAERATLADTLRKQGRASLRLQAKTLLSDGGVAALLVARYVAIVKS